MGRVDLVILSRSLHDRAGSVPVPLCLRSSYARGGLGWFGAVDVGRVGPGGHAQVLRDARHRLGRDGRVVAAVAGDARGGGRFAWPTRLRLAQAVGEVVDGP